MKDTIELTPEVELTPEFTRRRYGTTTFTWVAFTDGEGNWYTPKLDPYPAVRPAKSYVEEAERLVREGYYS